MAREKNKHGGGAQTNCNGLKFERDTDILEELKKLSYLTVKGDDIFYNNECIASIYEKHGLYTKFLMPKEIDWKEILSSKLLPDTAVVNHKAKVVYIIEKKFQSGGGSVDEKLQTSDFKTKQYSRLIKSLPYKVQFIFLLNDWFEDKKYDDVKKYIKDIGSNYFIETLPWDSVKLDENSLK
ncbi:MAG: hypothetical protein HAW64_02215 [Alphaproteobacteria bacterium]|nr:hypothetical protein [Alphaproteobacteria bacterium]